MNPGKITCEILKKIRSEIAEANQIDYLTEPCTFKGACIGTCPKCEAELRELEHQLTKKQGFPKTALIAGVSLSILSTFSSCQEKNKNNTNIDNKFKTEQSNFFNNQDDTIPASISNLKKPAIFIKNNKNKILFQKEIDTSLIYQDTVRLNEVCVSSKLEAIFVSTTGSVASTCKSEYNFTNRNEIEPYFPNGLNFLEYYLNSQLSLPKNAYLLKRNIVAKFLISESGEIRDVHLKSSKPSILDDQILKLLEKMPDWEPAKDELGNSMESIVLLKLKVNKSGIKISKIKYAIEK